MPFCHGALVGQSQRQGAHAKGRADAENQQSRWLS
jgi:hypothetical protein